MKKEQAALLIVSYLEFDLVFIEPCDHVVDLDFISPLAIDRETVRVLVNEDQAERRDLAHSQHPKY